MLFFKLLGKTISTAFFKIEEFERQCKLTKTQSIESLTN